ncbi:MAG: DUF3536 domain-containing protein [Pseudanabaenaceae cyanobacterium]
MLAPLSSFTVTPTPPAQVSGLTGAGELETGGTKPQVWVVIHGHFYQPPRENPYLNAIERQEAAAPFHDWNERIHFECYRPNGFARIVSDGGRTLRIVNNFEYLSFNVGPTLLSWLEKFAPETYQRILAGDRRSCERWQGHGNAIAQVYNHIILPLANRRDKLTQIRWGKADFRARFGREPEGMWLAETAIDAETVDCLIAEGIAFTILAPSQALRCRPLATAAEPEPVWRDVSDGSIDPSRPYRVWGREGGYLDVFFYNGPISRDMGFGDLLRSSYNFAERLQGAIHGEETQLVSVATDGETFGHHKHFTEMTLAYAFTEEFPRRGWQVSNYAFYLHRYPPTWEVELKPVTAWSCSHGVDRWQADCGCGAPIGTGTWRKPLREALNELRDRLCEVFEAVGPQHLREVWGARDAYIEVVLAGLDDEAVLSRFWETWGISTDRATGLRLLEMQRHALLMFTSCGWFFEELSRPEGTQILRYAARALELAAEITGQSLEPAFVEQLALAPSHVPTYGNGAEVYRQLVLPHRVGPAQMVAQYAIDSLFRATGERTYGYAIARQAYRLQRLGALALAMGRVTVRDALATTDFGFAVLHLGGYDIYCCVQPATELSDYEAIEQELFAVLEQASAAALVLALSARFGPRFFTLQDLFAEERQRLLNLLAQETLTRLDRVYDQVYRDNYGILAAFRREKLPVPAELQVAAAVSLNQRLIAVLQQLAPLVPLPLDELAAIATEGEFVGCTFPRPEAARILEEVIWQRLHHWLYGGEEPSAESPQSLAQLLVLVERLGIAVDLRRVQELYFAYFDRRDEWRPPMPFWPELPLATREAFLELGDRIGLDVRGALEAR